RIDTSKGLTFSAGKIALSISAALAFNGSSQLDLANLGVGGTYANPTSITVDNYGRITAIS
ncbi:MAG: hypothetical protein ACOCXX_05330, partial [Planctomycetota bacterium]